MFIVRVKITRTYAARKKVDFTTVAIFDMMIEIDWGIGESFYVTLHTSVVPNGMPKHVAGRKRLSW